MRSPVTGSDWAPLFLAALELSGRIAPAARAAGVGRRTTYDRRERDAGFAAAWDRALDASRSARIVERTPRTDGTLEQLAARVRAVGQALRSDGLLTLADELASVGRHLDRQARDLRLAREREQSADRPARLDEPPREDPAAAPDSMADDVAPRVEPDEVKERPKRGRPPDPDRKQSPDRPAGWGGDDGSMGRMRF